MKPLTIEQLKILEVGDWVWLCADSTELYAKVFFTHYVEGLTFETARAARRALRYSDYGTKWLAYKNKEQAETKGEIVEVVEYNGYAPYLARDNICGQPLLIVPISEERNKELKEQGVEDTDLCVFLE